MAAQDQGSIVTKIDSLISFIKQDSNATNLDTKGKVIKCKAAIAWKVWDEKEKEPLTIEEVEVSPPIGNQVRIKILYTGVCHSDMHALTGRNPSKFPLIFGHEGIGIIESIGDKVTSLKPGDAVIPLWLPQCKSCKSCKSGKTNQCDQTFAVWAEDRNAFKCKGQKIGQFLGTSTFSQYTIVPELAVAKINPAALLKGQEACLIGCAVTTGMQSVRNTMKVEPGSTAAVFGLGGVGLSAVIGCKLCECKEIIAVDINTKKFEIAKKLGATICVNPMDDKYKDKKIQDVIVEITDGGVDYSFECIGLTSTMRAALECCHKGWGKSCIVGIAASEDEISTRPFQLVTGREWTGAFFGNTLGRDEIPGIVEEYLQGKIDINTIVTNVVPFSEINDGFWFMKQKDGVSIRTVVDLWK